MVEIWVLVGIILGSDLDHATVTRGWVATSKEECMRAAEELHGMAPPESFLQTFCVKKSGAETLKPGEPDEAEAAPQVKTI